MLFASQNEYKVEAKAREKVLDVITDAYNNKDSRFGNARYVRNLFESVISNQANRIVIKKNPSKKDFETIKVTDIK